MKKYKQTVIPEVSTDDWKHLSVDQVREKLFNEYRNRYKGKKVVNQDLGICVKFEVSGARKVSHGTATYSKKACLISVLDQLIEYAEYNNWGNRKEKDPPNVVGYFNFKAKVKIDGKIEHIRLVIRLRNDGKFHYSMEVNKKTSRKVYVSRI